jgi:hypothetical protein
MMVVPFTMKRDLRGLKEPTLSGHKLQLATKVKYLGLTLDKGLTWKTARKCDKQGLQGFLDLQRYMW